MRKTSPFKRFVLFSSSRWFSPGIGLKRWLLVLGLGTAVASLGLVNLLFVLERQNWLPISVYDWLTLRFLPAPWHIVLPLLVGSVLVVWGVLRVGRALTAPFQASDSSVAERIYEHSRQKRGPNIVAIGGGT